MKAIDYYLSLQSPWTYLGHARLAQVAERQGATINVKPVDYRKVFPISGGLPLPKRAPQRQAYRLVELKRWREFLGVPLTIEPKYFPFDSSLATLMVVAADGSGAGAAMRLAGAVLKGCWAEERNMGDEAELFKVVVEQGMDPRLLALAAKSERVQARYDELTQEAIDRQVFGAPTYVYKNQLFWGQDRLEFLERALQGS